MAVSLTSTAGAVAGSEFTFSPAAPRVGDSVTFTSTEDCAVAVCTWSGDDGLAATGGEVTKAYATAGEKSVTLTVLAAPDAVPSVTTKVVTVAELPPPNVPPVASFSFTLDGRTATFTSTSSDPDDTTLDHTWSFGDGTPDATGSMVTHTYAAGEYTATLTVTDADNAGATTTRTVTVVNRPPTARFATPTTSGLTASFTSTSNDPDGDTLIYRWDFGDGSTAAGPTPVHPYATGGTYSVTLTVTDQPGGVSHSTTGTVTVNRPPTAGINHTAAGLTAVFESTSKDLDLNDELSYSWDFGDRSGSTAANPSHTYGTAGTYQVTLKVTDNSAQPASDTSAPRLVTVQAPIPGNRAPSVGFTSVIAGADVSFAAKASDPENDALSYAWSFGDGSTSRDGAPSHTYALSGSYVVILTVTDARGAVAEASETLTISVPATAGPLLSPAGPAVGGGNDLTAIVPQPTPPAKNTAAPKPAARPRAMSPVPLVRITGTFVGRSVRVGVLTVRAPARARVTITCSSGRRCPTQRLRAVLPTGRRGVGLLRLGRYSGRVLTAGTVLEIRVTQPGRIGKHVRLEFRARLAPLRKDACMRPGRSQAVSCASLG